MPRNRGDAHRYILNNMDPDLYDRLIDGSALSKGETTLGIMRAVAAFPKAEQPGAYEWLNRLGSRAAKRVVECMRRPPTRGQMMTSLCLFAAREFPLASTADLAAACRLAVEVFEETPEAASRPAEGHPAAPTREPTPLFPGGWPAHDGETEG